MLLRNEVARPLLQAAQVRLQSPLHRVPLPVVAQAKLKAGMTGIWTDLHALLPNIAYVYCIVTCLAYPVRVSLHVLRLLCQRSNIRSCARCVYTYGRVHHTIHTIFNAHVHSFTPLITSGVYVRAGRRQSILPIVLRLINQLLVGICSLHALSSIWNHGTMKICDRICQWRRTTIRARERCRGVERWGSMRFVN